LAKKLSAVEFIKAEAVLRKTLADLKVVRRRKIRKIRPSFSQVSA